MLWRLKVVIKFSVKNDSFTSGTYIQTFISLSVHKKAQIKSAIA